MKSGDERYGCEFVGAEATFSEFLIWSSMSRSTVDRLFEDENWKRCLRSRGRRRVVDLEAWFRIVPPRCYSRAIDLTASEALKVVRVLGATPILIAENLLPIKQGYFPYTSLKSLAGAVLVSDQVWLRLARKRLVPHYRFGGRVYFDPAEICDYYQNSLTVPDFQ